MTLPKRSIGVALLAVIFCATSVQAQRQFGVDVSHYQGSSGISQASWNLMYAEGKRFVFIKATEGLTGPDDPAMANNVTRAAAAGLRVGVYHYAHPENRPTPAGAVQEADHFLDYSGTAIGPGFLRPVLDIEGSAATLSTAALTEWIIAFCDHIAAQRGSDAVPIIYCSQFFANNEMDSRLAGYDLWLRTVGSGANPATDQPPGQGFANATGVFNNWAFWQYSATGTAGGISPIDLNVCHDEHKPLDAYLIPDNTPAVPPAITAQPLNRVVTAGDNVRFTVAAAGTPPLSFQWRFNGGDIPGATGSGYTRTNAQQSHAGGYSVLITNVAGSVTSSTAAIAVVIPEILFQDNFDDHASPNVVTSPGTVNGYKLSFGAASGPVDFTAIFGFDYSTVTHPTSIPPAPRSTGGATRGLFLTVNKDATAAAAAVNVYPENGFFTGNYALKFDMWINWTNAATATEHALFGINHSGDVFNRIGQTTSDGLFFAVDGDGGITATSAVLRDFSVFRGGGEGVAPVLLLPGNTTFGPTPLLAPTFDNSSLATVFPSKAIAGYPTTPAGSAGLGWVSCEVRQEDDLITWLLDDIIIAQYTNTSPFSSGNIMLGYLDHFSSIGDPNNFVIFDNIRVDVINPDSDGNGLPDAWEMQYFGYIGVEPGQDADGDRASNLEEFLAGTNPVDSLSVFRMLSAVKVNDDVLLSWTTVGGRSYMVQFAPDEAGNVTGNFSDVSPVISAAGTGEGSTTYLHAGGGAHRGGYYRMRLVP